MKKGFVLLICFMVLSINACSKDTKEESGTILNESFASLEIKKDIEHVLREKKEKQVESNESQTSNKSQNLKSNEQQPVQNPQSGNNQTNVKDEYKEQPKQEPQQPSNPNVCVPDGTYGRLGNSGKVFYSKAEADTWANDFIDKQSSPWQYHGYHAITVIDSCGNERDDLWTVGFY